VEEVEGIRLQWEAWLARNGASLRRLDHPLVLERAAKNLAWGGIRRRLVRVPQVAEEEQLVAEVPEAVGLPGDAAVLIAEIPRAGDRWKQANFDIRTYEDFFGARVGTQRHILLQHVTTAGVVGVVESRPSVEVASQNYRFELDSAKDLDYPAVGRPIGVFLRVRPRAFVYRLVMPGDVDYVAVSAYLDTHWHGRRDRMRRIETTMGQAAPALAASPIWDAATHAFQDDE
jgi:hypothetical protein